MRGDKGMKKLEPSVTVRMAKNAAERRAAYRVRYEVYIEEMGWETEYADHETRLLEQPLDQSGEIWIALADGVIVGTLRINLGCRSDLGFYPEVYSLGDLGVSPAAMGIVTNFVMLRPHRNLAIAMRLVRAVFATAVHAGIQMALLDCEPRMVRLYSWLGFEVHKEDFVHPYYGPGICMKMDIGSSMNRFLGPEVAMAA